MLKNGKKLEKINEPV